MSDENKETNGGETFAELLARSSSVSERLSPGQRVKSRIISISGELVYVDLGGKSDGIIDLEEFRAEDGSISAKIGDEIEASFVSMVDGIRKLSTLVNGFSAARLGTIRDACESRIPVTGDVKREVKGGFEVSLGGIRSFCPFSQIDLSGGREGGVYLGQTFPFKILEFEENGRNIIVSRRALLEEEKKVKAEKLKETLTEGAVVTGKVRSIQKFGAFVDLGGTDGLIPISEMAWNRTEKAEDVVAVGQDVTVKVIALDWEKGRLTLSLKALQSDPWSGVAERYQPDDKVNGKIVRLAPFGVFVNLEPGIDGLIHISNLGAGRRINHPREVVETGQAVEAYVLAVDSENRKISLSLQPKPKPKEIVYPAVGELINGTVEKIMPYGLFVKINEDLTGLIPNSEMATPIGTDHTRMFPAGSPMRAIVLDVDKKQGKVRLSRKGVLEREEKEDYLKYRDSLKKENESDGLGSLGKLLKAKMEEKKAAQQ